MIIFKAVFFIATAAFDAAYLFFLFYNSKGIGNFPLFVLLTAPLVILGTWEILRKSTFSILERFRESTIMVPLQIAAAAFLVVLFLKTMIFDYFQPISLFDIICYLLAVAWNLTALLLIINSLQFTILKLMGKSATHLPGTNAAVFILILSLPVLLLSAWISNPDFSDDLLSNEVLYDAGDEGYKTYRIPSLLIIPSGSRLASGEKLSDDLVLTYAEARRDSALDYGDVDLVSRISRDGGRTWSGNELIARWEEGIGKAGNAAPVFDSETGVIHLPFIMGPPTSKQMKSYIQSSPDGGRTWTDPQPFGQEGDFISPSHGIQKKFAPHKGRLIIPAYNKEGSFILYSDDNGATWNRSANTGEGNECEVAELSDGSLYFSIRVNIGVAKFRTYKVNRSYVRSNDGGTTWSQLQVEPDIPEPICMASTISYDKEDMGLLHFSPDNYFNRTDMAMRISRNGGYDWEDSRSIYDGPSGYVNAGMLSNGNVLVLFENGRYGYSDRINLVSLDPGL